MKLLLSVALCAALMAMSALANPAQAPAPQPSDSALNSALDFGVDNCDLTHNASVEAMFESWQKHHGVKFNRTTNATHYHKA